MRRPDSLRACVEVFQASGQDAEGSTLVGRVRDAFRVTGVFKRS